VVRRHYRLPAAQKLQKRGDAGGALCSQGWAAEKNVFLIHSPGGEKKRREFFFLSLHYKLRGGRERVRVVKRGLLTLRTTFVGKRGTRRRVRGRAPPTSPSDRKMRGSNAVFTTWDEKGCYLSRRKEEKFHSSNHNTFREWPWPRGGKWESLGVYLYLTGEKRGVPQYILPWPREKKKRISG